MEFYIYNALGEYSGVIDECSSVQWEKKYSDTGTFEIHVPDTIDNNVKYALGSRIMKSDDNDIGFITYVLSTNKSLEIRGYLDNLADRIVRTTTKIKNVEKDLYTMTNSNKRNLDIKAASLKGLSETTDQDITWSTLREVYADICTKTGLGYRMNAIGDDLNVIEIYKKSKNEDVQFSEDIGNIIAQSYEQDRSDYKNYAIVAGEGEGAKRIIVEVNQTGGQERYELYVDARDLSKTYTDASGNEKTYTDAEYKVQLKERGISKLAETPFKKNFTCEIDLTNESFIYGQDYSIGDIVQVKSIRYGFTKWFRLSTIKEIYEDTYSIVGTLEEV